MSKQHDKAAGGGPGPRELDRALSEEQQPANSMSEILKVCVGFIRLIQLCLMLMLIPTCSCLTVKTELDGQSSRADLFRPSKRHNHPTLGRISVALVMRTFHGHRHKYRKQLRPSLERFVNPQLFPLLIILDGESKADHSWAHELSLEHHVQFEHHPGNILNIRPNGHSGYYGGEGYARQLYSTFFLDNSTDADVIGVIDADNEFNTYLTYESIFDPQGRILHPLIHGDPFPGDSLCLREVVNMSAMSTEVMPLWFFRDTYTKLRAHVLSRVYPGKSFDEAWTSFANNTKLSPVNILSHFADTREHVRYKAITNQDPEGMITVATNRPLPSGQFWKTACCRMWGQNISTNCPVDAQTNVPHVLNFEGVGTYKLLGLESNYMHVWSNNSRLVDEHYGRVHRALAALEPVERDKRMKLCQFS